MMGLCELLGVELDMGALYKIAGWASHCGEWQIAKKCVARALALLEEKLAVARSFRGAYDASGKCRYDFDFQYVMNITDTPDENYDGSSSSDDEDGDGDENAKFADMPATFRRRMLLRCLSKTAVLGSIGAFDNILECIHG